MSERTAISWCDSTFNPWIGCTKVSPACDHCYAERLMDHRMHKVQWGTGQQRVRTSAANWRKPLQWNAQPFCACMGCGWRGELREAGSTASLAGFDRDPGAMRTCPQCKQPLIKEARRRVFCASLADVFDNEVEPAWREDLFRLIEATPTLDWLLLTKRIGNAAQMMFLARGGHLPLLPNVWLGATICNQDEADRDIPKLLAVPAAKRFLSIEPMLGGIWLPPFLGPHCERHKGTLAADGRCDVCEGRGLWGDGGRGLAANDKAETRGGIDWIIAGGESGPHARPMHPDWARSLRDQCAAAGVPLHFKQWGEWAPGCGPDGEGPTRHRWPGGAYSTKVGTKAAGRLLDGIEHNGFPNA